MKINKIEIDFPVMVEFSGPLQIKLAQIIEEVCKENTPLDHVMWPSSFGCKPTYIPMTQEEEAERGIEFDDDIFHVP